MRPLTRRCRFIAKRNYIYIDRTLRHLEKESANLSLQLDILNYTLRLMEGLSDLCEILERKIKDEGEGGEKYENS